MVVRRVIKKRKPRQPTDAQRRKSVLAKSRIINARPHADVATVTDECCTIQGIVWADQPTPCRHDCHYSEHAWSKAQVLAPAGPVEPAPVSKERMIFDAACGNCGKVLPIAQAVEHVAAHKPIKHPASVEAHDWPEAYADGQSWKQYQKRGPARRKDTVAA